MSQNRLGLSLSLSLSQSPFISPRQTNYDVGKIWTGQGIRVCRAREVN